MGEGIDEVDIALLDGVHVNPRVGFDELGKVLGLSGATVARRWRRLVDTGRAWVSSAIGPALPVVGALLEAECEPGAAQAVADRWAAFPRVLSVHITTGRYNVYALIVAADESLLARLVVDALPGVAGIRAVRASTMFRLFSGTYWRLGAISAHQAREVAPAPVAQLNGCAYCLSAHTYIGANVAKVEPAELDSARKGQSNDPHVAALLKLSNDIAENAGDVDDADVEAPREAGVTDEEIGELLANLALNILTNYFNVLAHVDNDWPLVSL